MVKQFLIKNGNQIKIAHKYNDDYDMWIIFDHSGANQLVSFSEWRLAENQNKDVIPELFRPSVLLQRYVSDWIGPYIMQANSDGNHHQRSFTGGNHAFDGGATGSPTARTEQVKVWSDDKEVLDHQVIASEKAIIRVVNYIQGYNTKLQAGGGREIVKETVTYLVECGHVQVHVEIEALADITLYTYYGLQTVNGIWNDKVQYLVGHQEVTQGATHGQYSDSGTKSDHFAVDGFLITSKEHMGFRHKLYAWLDRQYGLGQMHYLASHMPVAFTQHYGKTYFLLIKEMAPMLAKGEMLCWRGGYRFDSLT